jgi:hypothetical protein
MPEKKKQAAKKENAPVFILKPALKNYGLDYLHIELLAIVVILVALAFALASFKSGVVFKSCAYGAVNGTCFTPAHSSAQALSAAERILASYSTLNTSFSLLPYYALVNDSTVSYLPNQSAWFVMIPYVDPYASNTVFNFSMVLYGSNLSLENSFTQMIKPVIYSNNTVVAPGVVSLYKGALCTTSRPVPVYLITDPYSAGSIPALYSALNASKQFDGKINMSYYFVFTSSAINFYGGYGEETTQLLGRYLSCASRQSGFRNFVSNLSIAYKGIPLYNSTLYDVAQGSGLNMSSFGACITNSTVSLNDQARVAGLYDVAITPEFVVNCKYATIPQTLDTAINYSLTQTKG